MFIYWFPHVNMECSQTEVETHQRLSSFDLNTKQPAFSYPVTISSNIIASSELHYSPEFRGSEMSPSQLGTGAPVNCGADSPNCKSSAVTKVQKVYRSYRTRRLLADSAVIAEELWYLFKIFSFFVQLIYH